MQARAFSPGHVTGFVQFSSTLDSQLTGSLGAGFCINKGIRTTVKLENAAKSSHTIFINGKLVYDAEVSIYVIDEYLALVNKNYKIIVEHHTEIPIGYGLGSSGAAGLSLSLALNQALDTPLSRVEAAKIAHKADITCRCGVGTVLAEFHGGFEMRSAAGAPGIGVVEKIPSNNKKVILFCIGPVSTKDFLNNKIQTINGIGGKMLTTLSKTRTVSNFMHLSLQFARTVGFMSSRCKDVVDDLLANGYMCSVAMFGETVFSLINNDDIGNVQKILDKYEGRVWLWDDYKEYFST